ncbi:MAG: peptide-methionine (R)-S-oxide reductase MsrB [Flavobacteriales bacterium]
MRDKLSQTEAEWKRQLAPEAYRVMRQKGTEPPFSGKYNTFFKDGVYRCKGCGQPLFDSKRKFDAHCGWPAFDRAIAAGRIVEKPDTSHGMVRTEIICVRCGAHLGHVFGDGPTQTGLRYCVNSVSLQFDAQKNSHR